jgi:beta-glucanase (GH16 family)
MAEPGHTRPPRRWVLAGALGGAAALIALVMAVVGPPASGPPLAPLHAQNDRLDMPAARCGAGSDSPGHSPACASPAPPTTTAPADDCNALEDLLNACGTSPSTATTTTSTTSPRSIPTGPTTTVTTATAGAPPSSGACAGTSPPIAAPDGSWSCTFDDEFDGTSLDTSKWQPVLTSTSGYETGSLLSQACYVDNPDTISESGGSLNLSVVAVSPSAPCNQSDGMSFDTSYEAGMITSYQLFSQEYGYFQVRAEMPPTSVPGLQETLWLYPENLTLYGPWPDSGEIDYAEFYSNYPDDDVPAVHYPGSSNDPDATAPDGCSIAGDTTTGQYNTYALSWTPTTITTYFNGLPCITDVYGSHVSSPDTAPEPFNQPFFLAFTSALGMNGNNSFESGTTPLPATMKIDWVRAWQY